MKLHPRLSRAALELVTRFETFQPTAQPAAEAGWTVGYGHTRSAREGAHVTRSDAEALLLYDLSAAAEGVQAALFAPVTQRQFEALTAFAFNIGVGNFRRSSALARVNAGAELEAADEIERWRHAELGAGAQVVDALVRRRAAEKAHFLGLPEGFSKSPSAVLRPLAVEGPHEAEAPPVEATAAPSATLSAANTVQARLRELVPDPEPTSPDLEPTPEPASGVAEATALEPIPSTLAPGAEADGDEAPLVQAPSAQAPSAQAPLAQGPSSSALPPPSLPKAISTEPRPPADDAEPPPPVIESEPRPAVVLPTATPEARVAPGPAASGKVISAQTLYAALTALGACLLVAATVLILGGKASFGNLGLGVIGVLAMTPGVYGLLGGPRPPV